LLSVSFILPQAADLLPSASSFFQIHEPLLLLRSLKCVLNRNAPALSRVRFLPQGLRAPESWARSRGLSMTRVIAPWPVRRSALTRPHRILDRQPRPHQRVSLSSRQFPPVFIN